MDNSLFEFEKNEKPSSVLLNIIFDNLFVAKYEYNQFYHNKYWNKIKDMLLFSWTASKCKK